MVKETKDRNEKNLQSSVVMSSDRIKKMTIDIQLSRRAVGWEKNHTGREKCNNLHKQKMHGFRGKRGGLI